MRILIFGSPSRKNGFENPDEARSLEDGLSLLAQGARAKEIKCAWRNPGRVISSEIEACDAIVLENSVESANNRVRAFYNKSAISPAVIVFETLPDVPVSFVIRLDNSATGEDNIWTAAEIAAGKPWETLAPQIEAISIASVRSGNTSADSTFRGRLAKANRIIGELRRRLEIAEVENQNLRREFMEERSARVESLEALEGARNEQLAAEQAYDIEKEANDRLQAVIDGLRPGSGEDLNKQPTSTPTATPAKRKRGRPTKAEAKSRAERLKNA